MTISRALKAIVSPHFTEDELKALFVKALGKMKGIRDGLIEDMQILKQTVTDTRELKTEREQLESELNRVLDLIEHERKDDN